MLQDVSLTAMYITPEGSTGAMTANMPLPMCVSAGECVCVRVLGGWVDAGPS